MGRERVRESTTADEKKVQGKSKGMGMAISGPNVHGDQSFVGIDGIDELADSGGEVQFDDVDHICRTPPQHTTTQHTTPQHNTTHHHNTTRHNTPHHNTPHHTTPQYNKPQHHNTTTPPQHTTAPQHTTTTHHMHTRAPEYGWVEANEGLQVWRARERAISARVKY